VLSYHQFEDFAIRTSNQLDFSLILPLPDHMLFCLLQCFFNDGKQFELIANVSLLYGVEPLPGIIMRTDRSLIYVEGMAVTQTGVNFIKMKSHPFLYSFYMGYFIAGHFGPCSLFGCHPVVTWPADELIYSCQRYWLHKLIATELSFNSGWRFILIPTADDVKTFQAMVRKLVDDSLSRFPKSTHCMSALNSAHLLREKNVTKSWTEGRIDTFTYLCLLNRLGRRSLVDYTQYYVFPWVVSDYNSTQLEDAPPESFRNLSLPIGQIGGERSVRFDGIFEDSGGQYFYGHHYMHLGVVLFFLYRVDPFCLHSLYFHRGWDHQNRLFYDVFESWMAAAFTSPTDVKELVPEFYCFPEFLRNINGLPLTTTTDGRSISDVRLGAWCRSPRDFVHKMQSHLQSENTSRTLNNWIDLIFGAKSRGRAARESKNLYHPLCYVRGDEEEALASADQIEREAVVTCVINFGQCCHQVFTSPHPQITKLFARDHIMSDPTLLIHQQLDVSQVLFPVADVRFRQNFIATVTGTAALVPGADVSVEHSCIFTRGKVKIADGLSSASAISCSKDGVWMAIAHSEGGVSLYLLVYDDAEVVGANIVKRFTTQGTVDCIAISCEHFILFGGAGRAIERLDIGTRRSAEPIFSEFDVNCLTVDDHAALIIAGGGCSLGLWSISGEALMSVAADSPVLCVAVAELPEVVANRFFVSGHQSGCVKFWGVDWAAGVVVPLKNLRVCGSPIRKLSIADSAMKVVAVGDKEMFSLDYFGSAAFNLRKHYAFECPECLTKLAGQNVKTCAYCHRFLCQNCLPNELVFQLGAVPGPLSDDVICAHCRMVMKSVPQQREAF
jgi:hypothetical protein